MRKFIFSSLFILTISSIAFSQQSTPSDFVAGRILQSGEITPESVDYLTIQTTNSEVSDLPSEIREVDGDLSIQFSHDLESLLDFQHIQRVNGDLRIVGNPKLYDLSGLDNLQNVGGD